MSSATTTRGSEIACEVHGPWKLHAGERVYSCPTIIEWDESSRQYLAWIEELPGIVSEGATIKEACENVADALAGALSVYLENGGCIPWVASERASGENQITRMVTVNV